MSKSGHRFSAAGIEAALRSDPLVAHAAAFGTGHSYVTALLALDPAMADDWAAENNLSGASLAALAHNDELIKTVALTIAYANRDLPSEQRVRAFTVTGEQWVRGSELLSFDGTPQRDLIAARYSADLDAMYATDPLEPVELLEAPVEPQEPIADPTLPPFVTETHTAPPRWTGPSSASTAPAPEPAPEPPLVDPTPSYSAVLRPQRPLAKKDPQLSNFTPDDPLNPSNPSNAANQAGAPGAPSQPPTAQQPAVAPQSFGFADEDPSYPVAGGGGSDGYDGDGGDWDPQWDDPKPPARRWWWAVLVALVVVAAGAVIVKTISNSNSSSSSDTEITEPIDTTPDTEFTTDPDAVDSVPDTTPDTAVDTSIAAVTDPLLVVAERTPNLTTFLTAAKAAGLETDLGAAGPFTIFAPTDDAFNKLSPDLLNAILADKTLLAKVLRHHVVAGAINVENLTEGTLTALDGTTIDVSTTSEITLDKTARPVSTDIPASNGVIHTIDTVLLPPDVDPATLVTTTTTLPAKLLYTVYFTTSSRVMTSDGKDEVKAAAEAIKALPEGSTVKVVGYTMKSGSAGHQRFLARLRAKVVVAALQKAGANNVTYVIRSVIGLPRSGSKTEARRAEIQLPGYSASGSTTTTSTTTSSTTTTTMAP